MRCMFPVVSTKENQCLKMCIQCSFKVGDLSLNHSNEKSCIICGNWVFTPPKPVFKCTRHGFKEMHMSQMSFNCCICNRMFSLTPNNSRKATFCTWCTSTQCCMFNFDWFYTQIYIFFKLIGNPLPTTSTVIILKIKKWK